MIFRRSGAATNISLHTPCSDAEMKGRRFLGLQDVIAAIASDPVLLLPALAAVLVALLLAGAVILWT